METANLNNVRNVRTNRLADYLATDAKVNPDGTPLEDANNILQTVLIMMIVAGIGFGVYKIFWDK